MSNDDNRLKLVEARCDVETVDRLRQSYGEGVRMSDIEPWRLAKATEAVEAVMIVRYRARRSEETTDQARTLANAALVAIDDCRGAVGVTDEKIQRATRAVKAGRMGRASNRTVVLAVLAALDISTTGGQYETPAASDDSQQTERTDA